MRRSQRGWVRKRQNGWQACWREGGHQRTGPRLFRTRAEARDWLNDHLRAAERSRSPDITFAEHVECYLRVHAAAVERSTIRALCELLGASRH